MRLLEPLNGLKFAQGHFIVHLAFFISMLQISIDEEFLKPILKSKEGEGEKKPEKGKELLRFLEEKEKSKPKEVKTWKEIKENEAFIF